MPRAAAIPRAQRAPVVTTTIAMPPEGADAPANAPKPEQPDMWAYMRSMTAEEWKNHIVYLYRTEPRTSITGVGGYLTKLQQAFDIDDIKAAYGGREFNAKLLGPGSNGPSTMLYNVNFRIEAQPKLDATREAQPGSNGGMSGAGTEVAQQVIGLFREEMARRVAAEGGDPAANAKVIEMMSAASDRAMEMITKRVPEASNPATMMREMVGLMKEFGLMGGSQQNSIIETIRVLKELNLIGGAAVDPTAQLNSMLNIFSKLDELRGSGGRGKRDNEWAGVIERGLQILPGLLAPRQAPGAPAAASARMGMAVPVSPAAPPARAASPTTNGAAPPPESPAAAGPLPVVPLERGDAPRAPQAPAGDPAGSPPAFTDQQRDDWMAARVVEFVILGYSGDQVIDFLSSIDRSDIIGDIAKYPAPTVTQFFQAHPIMRQATEHPRWAQVLDEAKAAAEEWVHEETAAAVAETAKVN